MSYVSLLFGTSSTCGLETNCCLESIVDPPLKTCKGTDHNNSGHETCPKTLESDFLINTAYFLSGWSRLVALTVKFADHSISRMGYNCTENTSQITWGKGDTQLSCLVIVFFAFSEDIVIEHLDEPLESHELDNGVWHLPAPKRTNTLIQSTNA